MFSKGLTQCTPVNYSIVDDVLRNSRVTRNFKKHFELHTICTKLKWKLSLQTKSSDHLIEILSITTNLKNVRYLHGICTQLKRELSLQTKSTWPPDHLIEILSMSTNLKNVRYLHTICTHFEKFSLCPYSFQWPYRTHRKAFIMINLPWPIFHSTKFPRLFF